MSYARKDSGSLLLDLLKILILLLVNAPAQSSFGDSRLGSHSPDTAAVVAVESTDDSVAKGRHAYVVTRPESVLFIGGCILLVIAVLLLLAIRLRWRSLAPDVRELTVHVQAIGSGQMDHQAHLREGSTLKPLADTLNSMVSQFKTVQARLEENERQLRLATAAGKIGIWHWDQGSNAISADERARDIYGLPPGADLTFDTLLRILHPDDRESVQDSISAAIAEGRPQEVEYRVILPDGSTRWLLTRGEVVPGGEGKLPFLSGIVMDITSRRLPQEALRLSEEKFRRLAETTSDWVWEVDANGRYTYCSPRVRDLLGYEPEEILGKTPFDLMSPEEASRLRDVYQGYTAKGQALKALENINLHKDGHEVVLETSGMPFFGPEGELQGYRGIDRDITDRKRVELSLRESRQMLQLVLDTIYARVFWKDRNSTFLGCNKRFADDAGLSSPADLIGKNDFDMPWRDQAELYRADDRAVMQTGRAKIEYEEPQTSHDGSMLWLQSTKIPLRDFDGRIIGILGTYQDITARKQAQEALRQSEARFRAVFEGAPVGIITINSHRRIINANPAVQKMLGYSLDEITSKTTDEITLPEDRALSERLNADLFAGKSDHFMVEKRYVNKSGKAIWTRLAASVVTGIDPNERFGVGVIEDISAFKRFEEDLRRAAAELARSNRDLEQFAYVASHDLQEPLRMVFGHLQLISQRLEGKLEDDLAECLHFAVDGAQRMQSMIRDLLTYSRLGTQSLAIETTDSGEALKSALDNLQAAVEETVAAVTSEALPRVVADGTQLTLLFQNLIGNAIKYRREGAAPEIHVRARRVENEWEFEVRDNGIGIKPEFHHRIFQIFQRLHGADKAGTGIGLAVCKRVVERHGGRIWVESTPGEGSTFHFTIPDRTAPEESQQSADIRDA